MDLIASKLEKDVDLPMIDQLYERCNSAIDELRSSQPNPHISVGFATSLLLAVVHFISQFPYLTSQ